MSEYLHQKQWGVRVGIQQKMSLLVVFYYEEASSTPPDKQKKVKEKLLKTENPNMIYKKSLVVLSHLRRSAPE